MKIWASESPEGERRRAATAAAVAANAEDYSQLNVEAGFAYPTGAVISDGTPAPIRPEESPIEFEPTARPGHHLPHVWLQRGETTVSTVDLVSAEGFTLFVDASVADSWRAAAAGAGNETGCPLRVVAIGRELSEGDEFSDAQGQWETVRGTSSNGVVLVRPDKHIAWRAAPDSAVRQSSLKAAVRQVLQGISESDGMAGDRTPITGIEEAAAALRG